jgi:hypothetical protein
MATGSVLFSIAAAAADEPPVNATSWQVLLRLVSGLLAAAAVVAYTILVRRRRPEKGLPGREGRHGLRFPAGAAFSANDSWATTLTELVAAVGIAGVAFADKSRKCG